MVDVQTVLCPVDFSDATERQILFAVDICRHFGARLVVHHNLGGVGPGAAVGWMWADTHPGQSSEKTAEERLRRVLAEIPPDVASEARITHGPPTSSVLNVARHVKADLLVLTTHGESHDDHMSVTEQLLESSDCAVLALHEAGVDRATPRFSSPGPTPQSIVVPTSFSTTSAAAVDFSFELARRLSLTLHLLHIEPAKTTIEEPASALADEDRRRLLGLVPPELKERAQIHVATGDPAQQIAASAEQLGASLIVMGEHARTTLRRWFTRDTGRFVLHHAHCPVWYVPSGTTVRSSRAEARPG
jgi:nucleotide-binding universal stress UspA family protein